MKDNFGSTSSATDNIKVLVRVRPFDGGPREATRGTTSSSSSFACSQQQQQKKCVFADDDASVIDLKGKTNNAQGTFKFDFVRDEQATQESIFHTIGESVVEKFLEGFHGCVIAYGQTGAGKTYTMQGCGEEDAEEEEEEEGRYRWIDPARVAKDIRVYEQDDGRRRRDARSDVRVFGDL